MGRQVAKHLESLESIAIVAHEPSRQRAWSPRGLCGDLFAFGDIVCMRFVTSSPGFQQSMFSARLSTVNVPEA